MTPAKKKFCSFFSLSFSTNYIFFNKNKIIDSLTNAGFAVENPFFPLYFCFFSPSFYLEGSDTGVVVIEAIGLIIYCTDISTVKTMEIGNSSIIF